MCLVASRHVTLPGPRMEPVSPPLAGGFLSTVSPGKSNTSISKPWFCSIDV